MIVNVPCNFQQNEDIEKIRADAHNPSLTEADVFVFGRGLLCKSEQVGNGIRFTADSIRDAAPTFVGKAVNFDHQYRSAEKQVARIHDAWFEQVGDTTCLYCNHYAVKSQDLADVHTRMFNRQHRELSMGADIDAAHCSVCNKDVMTQPQLRCSEHSQADIVVTKFHGDHVAYTGYPAMEGAGLCSKQEPTEDLTALKLLAEDGREYRSLVSAEFKKWSSNRFDSAEIEALCSKLSAKEMATFARLQKAQLTEQLGDGKQQLVAPPKEEQEVTPTRSAEEVINSFRKE